MAALLAALAAPAAAVASQAIAVSVEQLARTSDLVVRGRVKEITARWSDDRRRIFTYVRVKPAAAWRGRASAPVTVLVPGGVVGALGQRVDGAPSFATGEDVVVFLTRAEAGSYRVNGLAQGKYRVEGRVARPDLSKVEFVSTRIGAGELAAGPVPLIELERRVRSAR